MTRRLALSGALLVVASSAWAHSVSTGWGPFFDGLVHLLLDVETLLPLLALVLFSAMGGPARARLGSRLIPALWLLGGLAGIAFGSWPGVSAPVGAALVLILFGVMVALDRAASREGMELAVGLGAALLGHGEGASLGEPTEALLSLLGGAAGLWLAASLASIIVVKAAGGAPWRRIALRVAGSWLAGTGLLMLGWQLRG